MKRVKAPGTDDATDHRNGELSAKENDVSWLHGEYPDIDAQININVPHVFIENAVWQDEGARIAIQEIHGICLANNLTPEEAIIIYKSRYL